MLRFRPGVTVLTVNLFINIIFCYIKAGISYYTKVAHYYATHVETPRGVAADFVTVISNS